MKKIDREKFFAGYRQAFSPLRQGQVDGLESILAGLEADTHVVDPRHAAYMLATAKHETRHTFQPVAEDGRGAGHKYGIPDPQTGQAYYGRGYVQLTWRTNYEAMGRVFGLDFVNRPELVMRPEVAYRIMSYGMRRGSFTGRRLDMYINDSGCDYDGARRIINGTDCAERIAGYAAGFEAILKTAGAPA